MKKGEILDLFLVLKYIKWYLSCILHNYMVERELNFLVQFSEQMIDPSFLSNIKIISMLSRSDYHKQRKTKFAMLVG